MSEYETTRADHPGRRRDDGSVQFRFNLPRAIMWVSLITAVGGMASYVTSCVRGQVVNPAALKETNKNVDDLTQQQQVTTVALTRVNLRIDSVNETLVHLVDVAEITAIDICLRHRNDPLAIRKLNCSRYLDGTP